MDTPEYRPLKDALLEVIFELATYRATTNGSVTVQALMLRDLADELRRRRTADSDGREPQRHREHRERRGFGVRRGSALEGAPTKADG
jgi:hypothetical protein